MLRFVCVCLSAVLLVSFAGCSSTDRDAKRDRFAAPTTRAASSDTWNYKKQFLKYVTDAVPQLLKDQDKTTGAWGTLPWIVTDQNVIFPLAAAWSIKDPSNPWYHNEEV